MLRVENISKRFRSGRGTVQALREVTFSLERRETLAIAGKSRSGKSTLLQIMGGLERPDSGVVDCFGVAVTALSGTALSRFLRSRVGFVFQQGNLLSYLSVFENVCFPLQLNGVGRMQRERRVFDLLDRIGLRDAARALPRELSGGEAQRVSIARAVVHGPTLLLGDEPTASLDSATGANIIELMFEMGREQECTVVVSTHDHEVLKLAGTVLSLGDGKVL